MSSSEQGAAGEAKVDSEVSSHQAAEASADRPRGPQKGALGATGVPDVASHKTGCFLDRGSSMTPALGQSRKHFSDWAFLELVCSHSLLALFREGSGGRGRLQTGKGGRREK